MSQMFTYGLSDLLLLAVRSLVVFVLLECILKVHVLVSSEHIPDLKYLYHALYILIDCFFKQIVELFLTKITIKY
jgi:hypothetical protein